MPDQNLYRLLKDYTTGKLSLFEVQDWISSREEQWASLPHSDPDRRAAGSVMLAVYELDAGDRDEPSVIQIAREALKKLESAQRV
jgi:hypothetical protein